MSSTNKEKSFFRHLGEGLGAAFLFILLFTTYFIPFYHFYISTVENGSFSPWLYYHNWTIFFLSIYLLLFTVNVISFIALFFGVASEASLAIIICTGIMVVVTPIIGTCYYSQHNDYQYYLERKAERNRAKLVEMDPDKGLYLNQKLVQMLNNRDAPIDPPKK